MPQLPEFFATQHNLHELAVLDEAPSSILFAVEDGTTHQQLSVEIFAPEITGVVDKSTALHGLRHPAIAPLVGTGTTADGQEFIVREGASGTQLSELPSNLSREEAADVFGPLASAVDFLVSRNRADFAVHGLREARVGVDKQRQVSVLAAAGPSGEEHGDAVVAFEELIARKCPEYKPTGTAESAKDVMAQLRPQREFDTAQIPRVQEPEPRPQQQFAPPQQPQPQPMAQPMAPAPKKKGKGGLIALITVLAVAAIAAAAALWFFLSHPSWNDKEQNLADAYPDLVGSRSGQDGFDGAKCSSREPEPGQEAKISCVGDGFNYIVTYYPSVEERDAMLPDAEPVELSNDQCTIQSFETTADVPTYVMAVEGTQSAFLVWGDKAEEERLNLPLCAS
ncbi:serine/threonine protein kinase [Corynebacterium marquesiae]|uniref:serine/threonine protein kinase n=1 Tax=Corynebacterium marquesiae TaxID=2913503 RepID=UPI00254E3088|nr:serine/threonine protein kinase [Corynebacterium marquesiae]MDK8455523.1 serine/threonine protein kinase [Corynebacterium marquesiae]MDK8725640.1 serine/threonine protein kinase [Corynebacterium marquesiae]MDK8770968.1 serine/threonine protein kinase [Corynebacterium marquesiae]